MIATNTPVRKMLESRQAARAARATGCSSKRKLPLTKGKALVKKTKSVEWFCLVCDENYAGRMNSGSSVRCASDGHTLNAPRATTHICVPCATLTASRPYSSGSCRCRSDDICHTSLVFNFDLSF